MRKTIAACAAIVFLVAVVLVFRFATGFEKKIPGADDLVGSAQNPTGSPMAATALSADNRNSAANQNGTQPLSAGGISGNRAMTKDGSAQSGATAMRQPGPAPLEFTNIPPEAAVEAIKHVLSSYASMYSGNPVGNNQEITAALNGNNPRQTQFIKTEEGMRINGNGEMIDPWGTPYFFHQISGHEMEIHSAGPDKVMWTKDDLVSR